MKVNEPRLSARSRWISEHSRSPWSYGVPLNYTSLCRVIVYWNRQLVADYGLMGENSALDLARDLNKGWAGGPAYAISVVQAW